MRTHAENYGILARLYGLGRISISLGSKTEITHSKPCTDTFSAEELSLLVSGFSGAPFYESKPVCTRFFLPHRNFIASPGLKHHLKLLFQLSHKVKEIKVRH